MSGAHQTAVVQRDLVPGHIVGLRLEEEGFEACGKGEPLSGRAKRRQGSRPRAMVELGGGMARWRADGLFGGARGLRRRHSLIFFLFTQRGYLDD